MRQNTSVVRLNDFGLMASQTYLSLKSETRLILLVTCLFRSPRLSENRRHFFGARLKAAQTSDFEKNV